MEPQHPTADSLTHWQFCCGWGVEAELTVRLSCCCCCCCISCCCCWKSSALISDLISGNSSSEHSIMPAAISGPATTIGGLAISGLAAGGSGCSAAIIHGQHDRRRSFLTKKQHLKTRGKRFIHTEKCLGRVMLEIEKRGLRSLYKIKTKEDSFGLVWLHQRLSGGGLVAACAVSR
jgi:hypothetical protein